MNNHGQDSPKIIGHLPSMRRMIQLKDWRDNFDSQFIKESIEAFKKGMAISLDYIKTHHPSTVSTLNSNLIIFDEPPFNAFLDTTPKVYSGDPGTEDTHVLGEICVNIGIPMTLACIEPVLFFANKLAVEGGADPVPTEVVVNITHLFTAWHDDTYPTPFVKSLRNNPALDATLAFIVAHEVSHYLFRIEQSSFVRYQKISTSVLDQLLNGPEFLTAPQIDQVKRIFLDPKLHASWIEELAADVLAYDICSHAFEKKVWNDSIGLTTICALQVIYESYLELENGQFTPTHPYALARLLVQRKISSC